MPAGLESFLAAGNATFAHADEAKERRARSVGQPGGRLHGVEDDARRHCFGHAEPVSVQSHCGRRARQSDVSGRQRHQSGKLERGDYGERTPKRRGSVESGQRRGDGRNFGGQGQERKREQLSRADAEEAKRAREWQEDGKRLEAGREQASEDESCKRRQADSLHRSEATHDPATSTERERLKEEAGADDVPEVRGDDAVEERADPVTRASIDSAQMPTGLADHVLPEKTAARRRRREEKSC
jgi:hypothetical protein